MTTITADVTPTDDTTDLARDFIKLLVASILKTGSVANFADGYKKDDSVKGALEGRINLFAGFLDDSPDDAGVVSARELEALGSEPFRNAHIVIMIRCKDGSGFSGRAKSQAACKAIEAYLRPLEGFERTLDTLPSGRRILAYEHINRTGAGRDASGRSQAVIEFDLRIQEAGTP